jgi:hypothetical protein
MTGTSTSTPTTIDSTSPDLQKRRLSSPRQRMSETISGEIDWRATLFGTRAPGWSIHPFPRRPNPPTKQPWSFKIEEELCDFRRGNSCS